MISGKEVYYAIEEERRRGVLEQLKRKAKAERPAFWDLK